MAVNDAVVASAMSARFLRMAGLAGADGLEEKENAGQETRQLLLSTRATARHLCDAALTLASDADPEIRAVAAASVQVRSRVKIV